MPAKVANVDWRCGKCGKRRWLKPGVANRKKFCSRECLHASLRVERPVRPKQGRNLVRFGIRECTQCGATYEAKAMHQLVCSQDCHIRSIHNARQGIKLDPKPCEHCGTVYKPRSGHIARFCSRACYYAGTKGEKAAHWRGGRNVGAEGYVRVYQPDHPAAMGHGGYVAEHRLIMERKLGRSLLDHETVHHINGQKDDNRPENLQVRNGRHGKGWINVCGDCGSHNIIHEALAVVRL